MSQFLHHILCIILEPLTRNRSPNCFRFLSGWFILFLSKGKESRMDIGINLCFLFSSYVYHLRIYLNNFFQKKTTEQSWACRMMHVPGQFLKSSLTLSLESLMLRRDRNNQEACAELVRLSLAGKTAWGCLAEAIRCLLLSNSVSYEKLKLTLMVEYGCCLSISSPQWPWNWAGFFRPYWA